jgi:hypothetical protein
MNDRMPERKRALSVVIAVFHPPCHRARHHQDSGDGPGAGARRVLGIEAKPGAPIMGLRGISAGRHDQTGL